MVSNWQFFVVSIEIFQWNLRCVITLWSRATYVKILRSGKIQWSYQFHQTLIGLNLNQNLEIKKIHLNPKSNILPYKLVCLLLLMEGIFCQTSFSIEMNKMQVRMKMVARSYLLVISWLHNILRHDATYGEIHKTVDIIQVFSCQSNFLNAK